MRFSHNQPATHFISVRGSGLIFAAWRDGVTRVLSAPSVIAGVFVVTLLSALPLAVTLRDALEAHLGRSLMADHAADSVNFDWWQEFSSQATGIGSTFSPSILGFASTLDSLSSLVDARAKIAPVVTAIAVYLLAWIFLSGGILDRYARQRPTRAHAFFAASGVFFFRFLRLAVLAGAIYWLLFHYVHEWLFEDWLTRLTRDVSVERTVFAWRLAAYAAFGLLLLIVNVIFDYAKVRAVVEDRRSAIGALAAALRFVAHHPGAVSAVYALNALLFLVLIGVWAAVAPGAGGSGPSMWGAFALGELYLLARLMIKLQFMSSEISLFHALLAHAKYTAAPEPVWPEPPIVERIG